MGRSLSNTTDWEDAKVKSVTTVIRWRTLWCNIVGEIITDAVVREFVVGSKITILHGSTFVTAVLEDSEKASRPEERHNL